MTASNQASTNLSERRTSIRRAIMVYAKHMFPAKQYAYAYQATLRKAVYNHIDNSVIECINDNGLRNQ